jgi:DNA primase large subunit
MVLIIMKYDYLRKYNFLDECKDYLRTIDFKGFEDLEDSKYEHMFKRAMDRIRSAVDNDIYQHSDNVSYEIISFVIAVKVIQATGNRRLLKRFVLYESMVVEQSLQSDIDDKSIRNILLKKFSDFRGGDGTHQVNLDNVEKDGSEYKVTVADYVTMMNQFNEPEWRLVNQKVDQGFVFIKKNKFIRLMRIGIMKYLEKMISSNPLKLPSMFDEYVVTARGLLEDFETVPMSKTYPPCMVSIIDQINRGENPNNISRVILTTYLLNRGISVEDVAETFNNTPDHDSRKTEYYISKLVGYKSYGCSKIESYGLCHRNEKCGNIKNPMHFKD